MNKLLMAITSMTLLLQPAPTLAETATCYTKQSCPAPSKPLQSEKAGPKKPIYSYIGKAKSDRECQLMVKNMRGGYQFYRWNSVTKECYAITFRDE